MSHLPLDARAILQHLNDLGYRNISAEQLREFLKDLRKLIKHEERLAENPGQANLSSLHKRSTASSRAKLNAGQDGDKENAAPAGAPPSQVNNVKTDHQKQPDQKSGEMAFDEMARLFREKLLIEASIPPVVPRLDLAKAMTRKDQVTRGQRRSRSQKRQTSGVLTSGESDTTGAERPRSQRRKRSRSRGNGTNRPTSLGRNQGKSDPVALYQYYKKEWDHFSAQIPGEMPKMSNRFGVRK
ncbi:hypothetical protein KR018_003819, partial [Drosophila ironensis]